MCNDHNSIEYQGMLLNTCKDFQGPCNEHSGSKFYYSKKISVILAPKVISQLTNISYTLIWQY